MENFKIIKTGSAYPDVLVYRDIDDEGEQIVCILAYGHQGTEEDESLMKEIIWMPDIDAAKSIISDFSTQSAESFCRKRDFRYTPSTNT